MTIYMLSSHAPGTIESDYLDLSFQGPFFLAICRLPRTLEESRIGAWLMRRVSPAGKPDEVTIHQLLGIILDTLVTPLRLCLYAV